jgi:septal ring-binding cell division protein DamX
VPLPKGDGLASARQLLDRRDYVAAANGFAQAIRTSPEARYSVQLLVACSDETVEKALSNAGSPELLILPVSYKGRSCYRLCWGLYDSESRADSATHSVPAYFREGGAKPKVSATAGLLP